MGLQTEVSFLKEALQDERVKRDAASRETTKLIAYLQQQLQNQEESIL